MKTKTLSEQNVVHEAMTILLENLEPAKIAKFLAARSMVAQDYVAERERLFAGETVSSLSRKIHAFEKHGSKDGG
jgi:hypothetical protein